MAELIVEIDGKQYRSRGKSWVCLDDNMVPPQGVSVRLNVLRRQAEEEVETRLFVQAVEASQAGEKLLRVLVTGARTWTDVEVVRRELSAFPNTTMIIHGGATGADSLAGQVAGELGMTVLACPAEGKKFGKGAGLIRNRQMLADYQPDVVIAFHPCLEQARGTRHMVQIARKKGVPVRVVAG